MEQGQNHLKTGNKLIKKVGVIAGITFTMFILLLQVENQVVSRQNYESVAQSEVVKSWGGDVKVSSPLMGSTSLAGHGVMGDTLIEVDSSERKRGVFHVPVFTVNYQQRIIFPTAVSEKEVLIPVKPIEQIQSFQLLDEGGKEIEGRIVNEGIMMKIPSFGNKSTLTLETKIVLRGSGRALYESDLKQENIIMSGNWSKPQFLDDHLPDERSVGAAGFKAEWKLMTLPKDANILNKTKVVGMNHLWVNTEYSMVQRSLKYGILFIALSFLFTFILEVVAKIQIHPFQYGLVGLSLTIFYLLLLALSEVMGFGVSYLLSAFLVVGLIAFYLLGFVKERKHVLMVSTQQLGLSGFFFVLLRLEERALLMGTIGLFIVLGLLMACTRKIDWNKDQEV